MRYPIKWEWVVRCGFLAAGLVSGCGRDTTGPDLGGSGPGRIAFSSNRDGNWEVYLMNADGSGQVNLTDNPADDYGAAWSPDGSRLAFRSDRDGTLDLYVMNPDGTGVTRLTNTPSGGTIDPAWSPDGARIAGTRRVMVGVPPCVPRWGCSSYTTTNQIIVMNTDASGMIVLATGGSGYRGEPAWASTGKIAFTEEESGGSWDILVMNADGTGLTNLTHSPGSDDGGPAWSPDGAKLAFWSNRSGAYDLYLMNADGTGVTQLTHDGATGGGRPAWSPDGTEITFGSPRAGNDNWEIYTMNADGSEITQLTNNTAFDGRPAWTR
jgi:TolB protein